MNPGPGPARVTGIGGVFFRSDDPSGLAQWYETHLGIAPPSETGAWRQDAGPTVLAPFQRDSDYFPQDRQFMLNLRVSDLGALSEKLTRAGIAVETRPEWDMPEYGLFARIHDPEGNPIELWQPPAET